MPIRAILKDCHICGAKNSLNTYREIDPTDHVEGLCCECGFSYRTIRERWTLGRLNKERQNIGLPLLKSLRPMLPLQVDIPLKKIGICSKCGRTYTDLDDIDMIEKMVEDGYAPCPIIECDGILQIRREKPLGK